MPATWEAPEPETTGDFLKLDDGDSALLVIMTTPMMMSKHTIPNDTQYGERFYCGTPEGLGCPICEDPTKYPEKARKVATEGFFPVWVESITTKGSNAPEVTHEMMMDVGGWAKVGAYIAAKKSAEMDGLNFVGVPLRVTRIGKDQKTRYDVQLRPDAPVSPDGEPVNVEEIALKMLLKNHEAAGYATEGDPFAKPGEDPDEEAQLIEVYTMLCEEAGLLKEPTRAAFLKSKGIVIRTAADYEKAIDALNDRLAAARTKAA